MTATDPHLSNLNRADRGQPAEQVCVCGHERELHEHFTDGNHCGAPGVVLVGDHWENGWCLCWEFTAPSWTWWDRLGVAVSIALWVGILVVLALGVTA